MILTESRAGGTSDHSLLSNLNEIKKISPSELQPFTYKSFCKSVLTQYYDLGILSKEPRNNVSSK